MQGRNQKSNSDPRTRNDRWKRPAQSDSAKDVQASGEAKPQSDAPSERPQGQRPPPRSRTQPQAQDGQASSERGASQNTRPQRSNRDQPSGAPSQARPRERFDGTDVSSAAQRPRNNQRDRRPQSKAVSGSDTQAQRPRNRRKKQPRPDSKQPVVFKSVKPVEGTLEDGETGARDVDDWDPDETPPLPPNPAGISTPDVQISQLSSIASPPSSRSQILALSTSTSLKFGGLSIPLEHKQWARETLGGDYSQFAPQSSKDFITSHVELGPLKHSQLVLSHRPDASLSQRKIVGGIVQASVSPP
ncbi:hypothetical protein ONZ45_g215 [Pleurotus djamor]|nr:hypothetical protein ONZ45_g215 [Pleurotus djamor]